MGLFWSVDRDVSQMDSLNALLHFETWPPKAGVKPYDPFNPVARNIYWNEMKKNIFDLGMDGWWLDSTEPDHLEVQDKDFDTKTYLGSFRRVHNAFPLMSNKGVYEHQRATTSDKRVFLLTRSSFLGQQRYASHSWSGDVVSTWEVMRKQLAAGLNYSLCGIPYWNTDLGGFLLGNIIMMLIILLIMSYTSVGISGEPSNLSCVLIIPVLLL